MSESHEPISTLGQNWEGQRVRKYIAITFWLHFTSWKAPTGPRVYMCVLYGSTIIRKLDAMATILRIPEKNTAHIRHAHTRDVLLGERV